MPYSNERTTKEGLSPRSSSPVSLGSSRSRPIRSLFVSYRLSGYQNSSRENLSSFSFTTINRSTTTDVLQDGSHVGENRYGREKGRYKGRERGGVMLHKSPFLYYMEQSILSIHKGKIVLSHKIRFPNSKSVPSKFSCSRIFSMIHLPVDVYWDLNEKQRGETIRR